jgi:hypothetical protein
MRSEPGSLPGGMLAVMDAIPEEQPTPRWVALYELSLLLRTASDRVHPLTAYRGWLHDAGYEPPERHRPVGQVQGVLLVAHKPADGYCSQPLQPGAAQPICN